MTVITVTYKRDVGSKLHDYTVYRLFKTIEEASSYAVGRVGDAPIIANGVAHSQNPCGGSISVSGCYYRGIGGPLTYAGLLDLFPRLAAAVREVF